MHFSRKNAPLLWLSALAVCGLVAPVAHAQTTLTGHYDNSPFGSGYSGTAGQSYVLASTATFDGNKGLGFTTTGGTITVNGADLSRNTNTGMGIGGGPNVVFNSGSIDNNGNLGLGVSGGATVTVNGGDFSGNIFGGLSLSLASTATVNGGTFTNNGEGIYAYYHSNVIINGGTFSSGTYGYDLLVTDSSTATINGGTFTGAGYAIRASSGQNQFSQVNINGGTFTGTRMLTDSSLIVLYGDWVGGPRLLTDSGGTFSGTLANGGGQQTFTYNNQDYGEIQLVAAPEPSQPAALGLGVLGLVGLALKGRKRLTAA